MEAPQHPAGEFVPEDNYGPKRRAGLIAEIAAAPLAMREAIRGLSDAQLDTRYRNWTVRQIVHHLADSHTHIYIRFKWTLTEDRPTIKPYDETRWAALDDARGSIEEPLALLDAVHRRWVQLLRSMTDEQFVRVFHHPERNEMVSLNAALAHYAWHARHHTGQILWLRAQHGW